MSPADIHLWIYALLIGEGEKTRQKERINLIKAKFLVVLALNGRTEEDGSVVDEIGRVLCEIQLLIFGGPQKIH